MKLKSLQMFRVPSLLLAAALQVLPMIRAALPAAQTAGNILAIIFRWGAGAAAALGGVNAVSGASTTITNPLNVKGTNGVPFTLRLTTAPDQAHYWQASGLPAGLSLIGTNGQTAWRIAGTPGATGTFNVGLTAKDQASSPASRTVTATLVLNLVASTTPAVPPAITGQPVSLTVVAGQPASFSVSASGTAPLRHQWRFGGSTLVGQTNATLNFASAATNHAGNYDVVVSNNAGSITSLVAKLTVNLPAIAPAITAHPSPQTVTQGQPAGFSVTATGTAPLTFFWKKGANVVLVSAASTLNITNTQPSDAGSYSVTVSNSAGTATSASASLTVNPAPQAPFISVQPSNQLVVLNSPASFSVGVGGTAPFGYRWFANGALTGTGAALNIPNAQPDNVGSYYVIITNAIGSVTSSVVTLTIISPPPRAVLAVQINGSGSVTPNYNGQQLVVGSNYTMTAVASAGSMFVNWSGGASSTAPTLNFTMRSNLVLAVNFQAAPADPQFTRGSFNGLFHESGAVSLFSSGSVSATTTSAGTFSARLILAGRKFPFTGRFDTQGRATNTLVRGSLPPLQVELQLSGADPDKITGRVTDGNWSANLIADRAAFGNTAPQAGSYTFVLPGHPEATELPGGSGFGAVSIDSAGRLKMKGTLADGSKISQMVSISRSGEWPLFVPLYRSAGSLLGWVTISDQSFGDLHGDVNWIKSQQPSNARYPMGFNFTSLLEGSRYTVPEAGERAINLRNGTVTFIGGNLAQEITSSIVLAANNTATFSDGVPIRLLITPATGLFKGTVERPAESKAIPFQGVLLQKQNRGSGFFLAPTQSGRVSLDE